MTLARFLRVTPYICLGAAALFLLPGAGIGNVAAKDDKKAREQYEIREALQKGQIQPLSQILGIATQQVQGEIIKVELEKKRELLIYEIKILTPAGTVREVKIDARTGVITKIEDD